LCLAISPAAAADALYGPVVGIDDDLGTVNDLQWAVNEATGIADALRQAGAREVKLLVDGAANKAAIEARGSGSFDLSMVLPVKRWPFSPDMLTAR
jgi:hypothetical protein